VAPARTVPWPTLRGLPPTRGDRAAWGKSVRKAVPRVSHAVWEPAPDRSDPVQILLDQRTGRLEELIPLRHGRMLASPFAFYRGSAAIMAADLGAAPHTGMVAQLCGDAHVSNFGGYAAADRTMVFDLNDFDETLPGPWEWDLKRLVASLEIAGRDRQFDAKERTAIVRAASRAYREAMREFAATGTLSVWYSRMTVNDIRERWGGGADKSAIKRFNQQVEKAMTKDSTKASSKLSRIVDGRHQMISDPPLLIPVSELVNDEDLHAFEALAKNALRAYRSSLTGAHRYLLQQFQYADGARKVVGVGSVGTRCWAILMVGIDGEPLMLQLKEAGQSVLAPFAGASVHANQGQRVVVGQQRLQASSDIFLGWCRVQGIDGASRDFYVRQLWDWKMSADMERQSPSTMAIHAQVCGWTLARGHARSGDRVAISAYLGTSDTFDVAMGEFATAYADQNDADYARFVEAAREGRVDVASEA
jgi:uncharacterized protein (DUF2252 family)